MAEQLHNPEQVLDYSTPLEPLFAYAFEQSLGVTMQEVRQSARYEAHLSFYEHNLIPNGENPLHDHAQKIGVHYMSAIFGPSDYRDELDAFGDRKFYERLDSEEPMTAEEAALVHTLNDWMIERYKGLLGEDVQSIAKRWKTLDFKAQREALDYVFDAFRLKAWKQGRREAGLPDTMEREHDDLGMDVFDGSEPLFIEDEPWPIMDRPNCLGMSLLLCAFAELAESDYIYINEVKYITDTYMGMRHNLAEVAAETFEALGDVQPTKLLEMFIAHGAAYPEWVMEEPLRDFHHSIAIKTGNYTWTQIDPYMGINGSVGLGSKDNLANDEFVSEVKYYWEKMPGLTVVDGDLKHVEDMEKTILAYGETMSKVSLKFNEVIKPLAPELEDMESFFDVAKASYALLAGVEGPTKDQTVGDYLSFDDFMHTLFSVPGALRESIKGNDFGAKAPESPEVAKLVERFNTDRAYRQRRIDDLITAPMAEYYFLCVEGLNLVANKNYDLSGPVNEIANPKFFPALAVLNHLRSWRNDGNNMQSIRMVNASSSQIFWHEAHQSSEDTGANPIMTRAEKALRMQNENGWHDRVALLMASLDNPEKEVKDGQEAVTDESSSEDSESR